MEACLIEGDKGGDNGRGQRQEKRACGTGIQGPRGKLGIRSRAERKRSSGMGGGNRKEGGVSRWTVKSIPEERGRVGCNSAV